MMTMSTLEEKIIKKLKGRYQIKPNIYVTVYLDICKADSEGFETYVSLKKLHDTVIPPGARLYFESDGITQMKARRSGQFDQYFVTVLDTDMTEDACLHFCTPVEIESFPDRRQIPRKNTEFSVQFTGDLTKDFIATNGSVEGGLRLEYQSQKAMMGFKLKNLYDFQFNYKSNIYTFQGLVKHIQYNWKTHGHQIGLELVDNKEDGFYVVNRLIDSEYTVNISTKQSIDTSAGKISRMD